jgi:hypothetical protein
MSPHLRLERIYFFVYIWKTEFKRYHFECLTPTFKNGRTFVMIWENFVGNQKSNLVFMPPCRRTATDFIETVYDIELLNFMSKISGGVLIEDGAHVHHSNAINEWRKLRLIEKLVWPVNSPDLNPIKNVWTILKDVVQHHRTRPKTVNDMKQALQEEWENISIPSL